MKQFFSKFSENFGLFSLLIFGYLLRLSYIFIFTRPQAYLWSDPGYYDSQALEMAKGHYTLFSTYWPPFFHLFLTIIYWPLVQLGLVDWRVKVDMALFALFYLIGFWCVYQIIKKLFSRRAAFAALAVLIFWYPLIFLNYVIMSENLFFPLVFLGLYRLVFKPLTPVNGLWLGLLWGMAFLTRPVFALALPLFVLWGWSYKLNWRFLANFSVAAAVMLWAMMAFNFYYTNGAEWSVSSNGGVGFAMLWCDAKSIEFRAGGYNFGFGPPANIDYPESSRIFTNVRFEDQGYYYRLGLSCLETHPIKLISNFSSIIKLFHSHLFPTVGGVAGWEAFRLVFKILTGLLFVLDLLTLGGMGSGVIKMAEPVKKYLYLSGLMILSLIMIVYLQNVGEERYLMPYTPFLLILAIPSMTYSFGLARHLAKAIKTGASL